MEDCRHTRRGAMGPCVAPGCRSNYKGEKYTASFKFPSKPAMREKWIKCVPRKQWACTKNSSLCLKHFRDEDIISSVTFVDADGSMQSIPSERRSLREGALPCIWPGVPAHLTVPLTKKQIVNTQMLKTRKKESGVSIPDKIGSYSNFVAHLKDQVSPMVAKEWCSISDSDSTVFYILDIANAPMIRVSVKIKVDLSVSAFLGMIDMSVTSTSIIPNGKLEKWSQLEHLLNYYHTCKFS